MHIHTIIINPPGNSILSVCTAVVFFFKIRRPALNAVGYLINYVSPFSEFAQGYLDANQINSWLIKEDVY